MIFHFLMMFYGARIFITCFLAFANWDIVLLGLGEGGHRAGPKVVDQARLKTKLSGKMVPP